nr:immunoglobulin heavy chain junction region [Mus musculus]
CARSEGLRRDYFDYW